MQEFNSTHHTKTTVENIPVINIIDAIEPHASSSTTFELVTAPFDVESHTLSSKTRQILTAPFDVQPHIGFVNMIRRPHQKLI